jgi:hypothetical protein
MSNIFVSIFTITLKDRYTTLKILQDHINNQTYNNILEWTIISDYKFDETLKLTSETYKINYIYSNSTDLNTLVKLGISNSISDYIIRMDDDDYYFNSYIEHCIDKLSNSKNSIANSDYYYVYDIIINKIFKIRYNNNILAYKKLNILNINNTIEKLVCEKLMIKIIHNSNKYFPKILTLGGSINGINSEIVAKLEDDLIKFIFPEDLLNKYKNVYLQDITYLDTDIVYLAGGLGIEWNPTEKNLGGSEQAIINLSENWSKLGKSVIVYSNINEDTEYNNVKYINWIKFPYDKKIKNLIAWRRHGICMLANNNFYTDNLIIDFHDNLFTIQDMDTELLKKLFDKTNYFNFKSLYHKECFINFLCNKNILNVYDNKYNIIENGVRIDDFKINDSIIRNPYRFCYCSSYDRGLDDIVLKLWNNIFLIEPKAELHVYYGMDYIYDDNFKTRMKIILSSNGVMDHGRQSMEMIIREKYLSSFHLYINNSIGEIDCINIKESLVTGCIPIISNFGVYKERDGLKYDWDPENEELCKNIVNDIIIKMKDNNILEEYRKKLKESLTLIDWKTVSKKWLNYLV